MTIPITLHVSDALYEQAAQAARERQRPLEELLTEMLAEAFAPFPAHPAHDQMEAEGRAYEAQHRALVAHYLGEYVAFHGGEVVDHDPDQLALVERVEARYPQKVVLLRRVEATLPAPLTFRSPRWVREK